MTDTIGWILVGVITTIVATLWGSLLISALRRLKLNISIPDLNASALISGFKEPGVLLALANMIFVIVTQLLKLDISVSEYMAVATPVIAVITGKTAADIAKYAKTNKQEEPSK